MRTLPILLLVAARLNAVEATFSAQEITTPFFDASGHLIRRLTAASAFGPFASARLEKGQVEFFAPESNKESTAILSFEHAHYEKSTESISGADTIKLTSRDGTISGQGYTCRLETGRLTLRSQVKFESNDLLMTGDQAEVRFDSKLGKKDDIIREVVLTGHIVVERKATSKAPFDRAETTLARYSAEDQRVYLKTPVTTWQQGQSLVMNVASEFIGVDLVKKTDRPAESAPTPVATPP